MKKIIQLKLKIYAQMILSKYKPLVIGITGSIGKSSTKEAIYAVLKHKYNARRNIKNYNNELGVPLTIIGQRIPAHFLGWLTVFWSAFKLLIVKDKNYPNLLILEMGVDRPGDMDYLKSITKCNAAVITMIGPTHLEYFGSITAIQEEKRKILADLEAPSWQILNYDNAETREIIRQEEKNAKVISFGLENGAQVKAENINFNFPNFTDLDGLNAANKGIVYKLVYKNEQAAVILPNVYGYNFLYASLAASACGIAFGMNLSQIAEALKDAKPMPGRMNLIAGIKNTLIIDDTYNSSPQSAIASLDILEKIKINPDNKKYAVLGDMLELGKFNEEGHGIVGKKVVENKIDYLITIGERGKLIAKAAKEANMPEDKIFCFSDSISAGKFIQERIKEGDVVLAKGSQGIRAEKCLKEIMADPLNADKILVRCDEEWKNR